MTAGHMDPRKNLRSPATKLLVVDDEPQVQRLIVQVLELNDYSCVVATSAQEARKRLSEEKFSLVLCDVSMPGESGLDLARYILAENPETGVVMISGADDPETFGTALEMGAYGYILKPFRAPQLVIAIANALRQRALDIENRLRREELECMVATRTARLQVALDELEREHAVLRDAHAERDQLLAAIPSILVAVDADGTITQLNQTAARAFGLRADAIVGRPLKESGIPWDSDELLCQIASGLQNKESTRLKEVRFRRPDGKDGLLGFTAARFRQEGQTRQGFLLSGADVTERQQLELQLRQAQKLESIGQLAAGIAHEINTPTQYVGDNIRFLQDSFSSLRDVLEKCSQLLRESHGGVVPPTLVAEIGAAVDAADVEYLLEEIPRAIQQSSEGIQRVSEIVRSMKEFAHPGSDDKTPVDLNRTISSTITVARNEWKYVAEVVTQFDPKLPQVPCRVGDFNQVILNMIVNAAHAISDAQDPSALEKGTITITTGQHGDWAEIRISDTGSGIPEAIRAKIFDPFFTTKQVGKGTGQGLAISHSVIVERHGGTISFETEVGKGTTFIVRLPIQLSADSGESEG